MLTTKKPAKAFECAQTMRASRNLSARSSKSRKSAPTKPETAPTISAKTASTRMLPWSPSRSLARFCPGVICIPNWGQARTRRGHQDLSVDNLSLDAASLSSHWPSFPWSRWFSAVRHASKTTWSYCQRRSKNLRRSAIVVAVLRCKLQNFGQGSVPSMAPSSRSSKESTAQTRSANLCDRFISTATLPGGRRSRTHTVHGSAMGM